jgi:DNA helicase-2/ATP-dependent DNA helicase PcrA
LTTRLAHILAARRAWPGQILAVTFTNKAAAEMKYRIGELVGGAVEGMPWLGTFHSIGARILRRHAEIVGLRSNFTILDTDDQLRLLKQLIKAENIDEKRWPARHLAAVIDRWKNRGLAPEQVPEQESHGFADGKGKVLYRLYQERLKALNAVDFGNLLLDTLDLFRKAPDVLADFQRRFVYMLVDEYQDTNVAQYLWLRLLAQGHRNICCVGDDDQSIYGWRGAEVDNILRFEKDFPGAQIVRLEQNYRSTPQILIAASHLIAANGQRLEKTLWTEQEAGEKLKLRGHWDAEEEAREIAEEIETLQRHGHRLADMAILVRASFQMREFEDRFIALGIPYLVIGGPRFYERAEVRDANAYFRLVAQPDDDLAFERIINLPRRGIGDKAMQTLAIVARRERLSLFRAARFLTQTEELKPQARSALNRFLDMIERFRAQLSDLPHTDLAETILDESGYTEMWQNDRSPEAQGRLENLKELVRSMEEFDSLAGYLEHIALIMDVDQLAGQDKVNIMTLHSAKGLEFRSVFLPGWEEGLFPHQRSLDESGQSGLEEERRLAYVGLTRARERVYISFAANRRVHHLWQSSLPSRFVDELPAEQIEIVSDEGVYGAGRSPPIGSGGFASPYDSPGWQRASRHMAERRAMTGIKMKNPASDGPSGEEVVFRPGERVFHQKFGYGQVQAVDGNKLTIDFEHTGQKKVIASFVSRK